MTRILTRNDTGPYKLAKADIEGDAAYICRCGLSRNQPFCDASHTLVRGEGEQLVRYVEKDGERVREPIQIQTEAPGEDARIA